MRQPKILTTLKDYSWQLFRADLIAGASTAMVALPLSLAIAIASGASPIQGLITAIVGGFFISLLGGSRVQIGGPTGAFIVVVYGVTAEHGYDGLVLATFMAGLILLIAGYFRAGRLIAYIPEAVINGFTVGIAIIIAASQLKDLLGLTVTDLPAEFLEKITVLWHARDTLNPMALVIAVLAMALITILRRMAPKFPGLIVVVACLSAIAVLAHLPVETIASQFGAIPTGFPAPQWPNFSVDRIIELLPSAFIIAFLAGVESLLSALVADQITKGHHRPNAEIIAQGTANIASSLFGGLPATGAIARTATNIRAGGKTPMSGIIHALIILLILLIAAPLVGYLVMPALAALLILTAVNMSEPHKWPSYMRLPNGEKFLLLLTLCLTVLVDLSVAIGVGVALGLVLKLHTRGKPPQNWSTPKR